MVRTGPILERAEAELLELPVLQVPMEPLVAIDLKEAEVTLTQLEPLPAMIACGDLIQATMVQRLDPTNSRNAIMIGAVVPVVVVMLPALEDPGEIIPEEMALAEIQ